MGSDRGEGGIDEVPLEEARERWLTELRFLRALRRVEGEEVPVIEAEGRVTSQTVTAEVSSPHYYAAALDGLALRSADTFGASAGAPRTLRLGVDGAFVATGSALPEGFDAVVPFSELRLVSAEQVEVAGPSAPWRNVRPAGEDLAAREVILPRHRRVNALEVGALLAGGARTLQVYRRPRVALVAVGSRLVPAGEIPGVGEMIETSLPILAGLIRGLGGEPCPVGVVAERLEEVEPALARAVEEHDLALVVAGPAHGTALPAAAVSRLGELIVHGVALKPGHSVALGAIEQTPVAVLPFYPVSVYVCFDLFVRPVLEAMQGLPPRQQVREEAALAHPISSPVGVDELLRVRLGVVAGRRVAVPISRGAALLMSLVRADGLLRIPAEVAALEAGATAPVRRLNPERSIDGNLIMLGTHDICFDLVASHLVSQHPELQLLWANTGSEEGLLRLREGLCHLAACHLFDPETGEYNLPQLRQGRAGVPAVLVNLFQRSLGLLVAPGNPKGIVGLEDLARPGLRFINRPEGSGTRALIDHHLRVAGVDPRSVAGHEEVASTHMAVAAAVAGGAADVGVGIPASAKALRLDFLPCIPERLDLVIPKRSFHQFPVQSLLGVIRSREFRQEATSQFEGYDFSRSGELLWESP